MSCQPSWEGTSTATIRGGRSVRLTPPGLQERAADAGLHISGLDRTPVTFPRSSGRPDLRLSTGVAEGETWVVEEHISDHFPLLATFDLGWEFPPLPRTTSGFATNLRLRTGPPSREQSIGHWTLSVHAASLLYAP